MNYLEQRQAHILAGRPIAKKEKKPLRKISPKRQAKLNEQAKAGTDEAMNLFFASMRPSMTGRCLFCGADTMKKDNEKFHFSLAHLLPKKYFKSVATHPKVISELCFYNNSCHTNLDNGMISWEFIKDSKEWDVIKEQLLEILPLVAEEERSHKLYGKLIELVYENK